MAKIQHGGWCNIAKKEKYSINKKGLKNLIKIS